MDTDVMRTLGMIFRLVYPDGDLHMATANIALTKPVSGLGLLSKRPEFKNADQDELMTLIDKIPNNMADPDNGVSIEDQGPFWIGFYHYATHTEQSDKYGASELIKAGQALYGERWQTDLARDLGLSDARRIRQWLSNERKIPPSIWGDIAGLLRHRQIIVGAVFDDIVGHKK